MRPDVERILRACVAQREREGLGRAPGQTELLCLEVKALRALLSGAGTRPTTRGHAATLEDLQICTHAAVPAEVHERGWQWRPTSDDTAFAPPFGTIRACLGCGCLVAGGPTNCARCAAAMEAKPCK